MSKACLQLAQQDEVEALSAIFPEEWRSDTSTIHKATITEKCGTIELEINMVSDYPGNAPPIYTISAPWLRGKKRLVLMQQLEDIYLKNMGESIIYMWIVCIRDFLQSESAEHSNAVHLEECEDDDKIFIPSLHIPEIYHGEIISDRRSSFQGHCAKIAAVQDVRLVVRSLKENRKVAAATHNIYAYRCVSGRGNTSQDCDDDGESAAGGRLLHLLEVMDAENVVVVVSRWYGGIQLGPDRFKHINNAARQVLVDSGLVAPRPTDKKNKKRR